MRANTRYIGTNGKQNAVFPLEFMYLTQGEFTQGSHKGMYAMDFQGMYNASTRRYRCPYFAPVDLKLVAIADPNNHAYVYESINEVNFIDGTSDYLTILVAHDNDSYSVGRTVGQGFELGKTGTYGQVSGDPVHMEVKKGHYEGCHYNSDGIYMMTNETHIYDVLGVNDTVLLVTGGYNWREFSESPIPPTPPPIPSNRNLKSFPWVLYAKKLRNRYKNVK